MKLLPYVEDTDFRLFLGDVRDVVASLEDESVDCCVTSPPYWALRDYGTAEWEGGDPAHEHVANGGRHTSEQRLERTSAQAHVLGAPNRSPRAGICDCGAVRVDKQIGLERTVGEYVQSIVEVFREVRRVLAPHGTCWLNLGDTYNSYNGNRGKTGSTLEGRRQDAVGRPELPSGAGLTSPELKVKDMVGVPWRVAFALQDDGWYLRSDVIWSKTNAMPESVTDRPSKSHEYLFMLTKRPRYYYDRIAVLEPFAEASLSRYSYGFNKVGHGVGPDGASHTKGEGSPVFFDRKDGDPSQPTLDESLPPEAPRGPDGRRVTKVQGGENSEQHRNGERWPNEGRNLRTVWTIPTQPLADQHFAVFPEAIVEKCVLASCPEEVCVVCGAPRERIIDRRGGPQGDHVAAASVAGAADSDNAVRETGHSSRAAGSALSDRYREHGYPTFADAGLTDCGHGDFRRGVVFDPFLGSGTTALVARRHGRACVGVELNEKYAQIALKRTQQLSLLA